MFQTRQRAQNKFHHLQTSSAFWPFNKGAKKPSMPSTLHDPLLIYIDSRSVSSTYTVFLPSFQNWLMSLKHDIHFSHRPWFNSEMSLVFLLFHWNQFPPPLRLVFPLWKLTDPPSFVLKTDNNGTFLHFVKTVHYSNCCCIKVKNVTYQLHAQFSWQHP